MMEGTLLLLASANFGALDMAIQKNVYREFYRLVYNIIYFSVKDHAITEDIIQEAFLKVVQNIPAIQNEQKLKSWIKVVVRNTMYNYFRKHKKDRNLADTESVFIDDDPHFSTSVDFIENEVELGAMVEVIGSLMQKLKPEYRALIEMRWKQELSYKEIAKALDLTEEAVKCRLHRAREIMKQRFFKEWGDRR